MEDRVPKTEIEIPQTFVPKAVCLVLGFWRSFSRELEPPSLLVRLTRATLSAGRRAEAHRSLSSADSQCRAGLLASGRHAQRPAPLADGAPTGKRLSIQHETQDHAPRMAQHSPRDLHQLPADRRDRLR